MYWIILFILFVFTCIEISNKRINRTYFFISYILLTILIVFRQGQGTDYYNYQYIYESVAQTSSLAGLSLIYHCEPGYLFVNYIATRLGVSYLLFAAIFALITMFVYYPFFYKWCKCSMIPLFSFYALFFLIYPFSVIREGLVLGIFVSYLLPLMEKRKYVIYILITILSATFHMSALICLLFPFVYRLRIPNIYLFCIFIVSCILILLNFDISKFLPQFSSYEGRSDNFFFAAIARVVFLMPIFMVPDRVYRGSPNLLHMRNVLFTGFLIYTMFSGNDITSSRLGVYCRMLEYIFLTALMYSNSLIKLPRQLLICYITIAIFFFGKNINDFINQGEYKNCNIFTYPYLSLFDSPDKIMYYRGDFDERFI